MWGMEEVRDQLEEELNEGGWTQEFGESDLRRSLFRATGISAAVCISTLVSQRRRGQVSSEMSYEEPDPQTPFNNLRPHPVSFDLTDDSDVESVRRMPISQYEDLPSSARGASESTKSVQKPRMVDASTQSEKPLMLDRGTSPLPDACFDSEVDSEEGFGLASGLWHFKPTTLPEASPDEDLEEAIQSRQKQWLTEFEKEDKEHFKEKAIHFKKLKQHTKEDTKLEKAASVGDTTWSNVVRYLWGTPSATMQNSSTNEKMKNKVEELYAPDW